jgi:6-phosphogluconolactonase
MRDTSTSAEIKVVPTTTDLYRFAADEFSRQARESVEASGRFAVALSGGSTPKGVYSLLAEDQKDPAKRLPWEKIHVFFGDERHVPPTDSDSNYRMASESLLSKVPIPEQNVHRVRAELDARDAAEEYEKELRKVFNPRPGEWPRFELILLGIGPDGHTASLFPGSEALNESSRWVVANWVEKFHTYRITLTFPVLNNGAEVMFLVGGEEKAQVVREIFKSESKNVYPCQRVRPVNGRLLWLLDNAAAKLAIGN